MADSELRSTQESNTEHRCEAAAPYPLLNCSPLKTKLHPAPPRSPTQGKAGTKQHRGLSQGPGWLTPGQNTSQNLSTTQAWPEIMSAPRPAIPKPFLYLRNASKKPINNQGFFLISPLTTVSINLSSAFVDSDPRSCFRACYLECQHP